MNEKDLELEDLSLEEILKEFGSPEEPEQDLEMPEDLKEPAEEPVREPEELPAEETEAEVAETPAETPEEPVESAADTVRLDDLSEIPAMYRNLWSR